VLVLAVLADPVRREIVELLAAGEAGAGEIAERFPVTRPAISRHLRVLREAGLVTSEVRAQRRVYRLDRGPLAELDAWLGRFRPLPERRAPERAVPERSGPAVPPGLANRLDALDTEIRRGRRRRPNGETHDDRSAG
jgi:DNA-binding transcriptional ArsR family regulator